MSIEDIFGGQYQTLSQFIADRQQEFDLIDGARQEILRGVAEWIRARQNSGKSARLTFICTHNSRRSHLSQVWAQVAAAVYGLSHVETFSGGTEATAMNPRAVASLQRSGLKIEADDPQATNPLYRVHYSGLRPDLKCFSKVFNQPPNPVSEYCAVMTCSQADEACPLVMGCELRAPVRYEDPKQADDTPVEAATYDERSRQICREMLYMMHEASKG